MRILITGASGLIGKNFILHALRNGHQVRALVRTPEHFRVLPGKDVFAWRHDSVPDAKAFEDVQAIIHLAGEGIADRRWTKARKKALVESRVLGTRNLVQAIERVPADKRPAVLISGSAIGYYGIQRDQPVDEAAEPGTDFLANLCGQWEQEAKRAETLGLRVVLARTGIVLSRQGGALAKMPPIRISDGYSWMSWIHIDDMARALLYAAQTDGLRGPVNFVSPKPVQNREMIQALCLAYGVPNLGFAPRAALALALGELSQALLASVQVKPKALLSNGFNFQHTSLEETIRQELQGQHFLDRLYCKEQFVPLPPERIFPFFSRAENLESLTPPWLNFHIVGKSSEEIRVGTLIDYKLNLHGVPVRWQTRISEWQPNEFFVDEQLKGPYAKWQHRHIFESVEGGCILRDQITYRIPGSIFGGALLSAWISRDVEQIFTYRQKRIQELVDSNEFV